MKLNGHVPRPQWLHDSFQENFQGNDKSAKVVWREVWLGVEAQSQIYSVSGLKDWVLSLNVQQSLHKGSEYQIMLCAWLERQEIASILKPVRSSGTCLSFTYQIIFCKFWYLGNLSCYFKPRFIFLLYFSTLAHSALKLTLDSMAQVFG